MVLYEKTETAETSGKGWSDKDNRLMTTGLKFGVTAPNNSGKKWKIIALFYFVFALR